MKIQILFQDRYLLIVSKPYGMPVYSETTSDKAKTNIGQNILKLPNGVTVNLDRNVDFNNLRTGNAPTTNLKYEKNVRTPPEPGPISAPNSVVAELQRKMDCKLHPVHRLDAGTAGVLLFGRDPKTASLLIRDFGQRKISKTYLAIVNGIVSKSSGLMVDDLKKKNEVSKRAETAYRILSKSDHHTLLLLQPKTGRFHQIRKQCKILGHPILGDSTYAGKQDESRLFLYALEIELTHPVTRKHLRIRAPLDSMFQKNIRQIFGPEVRV